MSNKKPKPDRAFCVKKVAGGWVLAEYLIQDGKVIKEKQSEPDFRDIALENFQRTTTCFWLDEG